MQKEARLVHIIVIHPVKTFFDSRLDGLGLGGRVASFACSSGVVLVVEAFEGPGRRGAGIGVGKFFDHRSDVVCNVESGVDAREAGADHLEGVCD